MVEESIVIKEGKNDIDVSQPRDFEDVNIKNYLSDKIRNGIRNNETLENIIDFSEEEVKSFSVQNYAQFLDILSRSDSFELYKKYSDIIVDRFGSDVDAEKMATPEEYMDVSKIGEKTREIIWRSKNFDKSAFSKENLEKLYAHLKGPTERSRYAIDYALNLHRLSRKLEEEDQVDYFGRYKGDIVEEIYKEDGDINKASQMVTALFSETGTGPVTDVFKKALLKAESDDDLKLVFAICSRHMRTEDSIRAFKQIEESGAISADKVNEIKRLLGFKDESNFGIDDIESDSSLSDLEKTLKKWHFAQKRLNENQFTNSVTSDSWEKPFMDYYRLLGQIDIDRLSNHLDDETFKSREALVDFLEYNLWLHWRDVVLSRNHKNEVDVEDLLKFERKKLETIPLLEKAVRQSSKSDNLNEIRSILEALDNIGEDFEAERMLFMADINENQRLKIAVQHINTFGFINTIDKISARAKDERTGSQERERLQELYRKLQGDEATSIIKELSEIYEKIDFSEYEINKDQLTRSEVDYIESELGGNKQSQILDLGAGTGRHALMLAERGYKNLVAFEYEQKHVDMIRESNPNINVIQGDWLELEDVLAESGVIDITIDSYVEQKISSKLEGAFCFGRTLAHNRTPEAMLQTFDQVFQVLDEDGKFLFDMPDVDWGVYQERIQQLRINLENLGVEHTESGRIFDGPNDYDKFNRMVLMPQQVKAVADMLGYKIKSNKTDQIEDNIKNTYYVFEKDPDFDASNITPNEHRAALVDLGLLEPGTDLNTYIKSWGMTIGQSLIYIHKFGLDNPHLRYLNEKMETPGLLVERQGNDLIIESDNLINTSADYNVALAARIKGKDAYYDYRAALKKANSYAERNSIMRSFIS